MNKSLIIIISILILSSSNLLAQKKVNLEGIEVGTMAPEIELPNVVGEIFKLSQLKDKVVLINFWASWCAPCRKKSPELLSVYYEFKDIDFEDGENGFEIVNVSLDRNEIAWKNSIQKDSVGDFINIGDMKGWKGSAATTYSIKSIPSSVLLSGKGEIIALKLSPKELKKKLKRMKKSSWFWF